jgi:hypothetical protein
MDTLKIRQMADRLECAKEDARRITDLFKYDTAAEQEVRRPGTERLARCDVSVEIGGPSVHAKLYGLTRDEIELLRPVLANILAARWTTAEKELRALLQAP